MFLDLVQAAALLLALSLLYGLTLRLGEDYPRTEGLLSGVLFGVVCIIGMLIPIELVEGVIFDARSVVLAMAGLFGGPVVGLLAAGIAATFRAYLGGPGTFVGVATVVVAVLAGLAYRHARSRGWLGVGFLQFLVFGLVTHTAVVALFTQLPSEVAARVMDDIAVPFLVTFSLAMALLGTILLDIEQRRETAAALRQSEARLRAIVSAIPDRLRIMDTNGRALPVDSRDRQRGRERGAMSRTPAHEDPWGPERDERVQGAVSEALTHGDTRAVEYDLDGPDGRRYFQARAHPLGPEAEESAAVVLARDVSDDRRAQSDLRVSAIAFEAQEGIVIMDAAANVLRVNSAFVQITGYTAEEVLGRPPVVLRNDRHDERFCTAIWDTVDRTGSWSGEVWSRRRNGEAFVAWVRITAVVDDEGVVTHYVLTLADLTGQKAMEDRVRNLAFYDRLTHLPNRRSVMDHLHNALTADAPMHAMGAVVLIDIDNFRTVNESFGHASGDQLLIVAARRLKSMARPGQTVAHLGGDEFVFIAEDLGSTPEAATARIEAIGERIRRELTRPYDVGGRNYQATCSIGATLFGGDSCEPDDVMKQAGLAAHEAKSAGGNALKTFDPLMQAAVDQRAALEQDMRVGLHERQFEVHYQVQVDRQGALAGMEALLRWRHPVRGLVPAAEFIPLAERTGLILPLGRFVLERVCRQLLQWESLEALSTLPVAVNISARQLRSDDFVDEIRRVVRETRANPAKLKLEITESMLLEDIETTTEKLAALQSDGVRFSLDDFGTGHSSLAYLKRLPLHELKIDSSFVRDLMTDPNDRAICRAVINLGSSLGLEVVAEGVETEAQRSHLLEMGAHQFQGWLFGRPVPPDELPGCRHGR